MRIVVVSPFDAERSALEALLVAEGHAVVSASRRAEGLALARTLRPDVVIADVQLAQLDGVALVNELARIAPDARAILLCSRSLQVASPLGATCLTKPIDLAQLFALLAPGTPSHVRAG